MNVINPNSIETNVDGQKWNYDFEMLKNILKKY